MNNMIWINAGEKRPPTNTPVLACFANGDVLPVVLFKNGDDTFAYCGTLYYNNEYPTWDEEEVQYWTPIDFNNLPSPVRKKIFQVCEAQECVNCKYKGTHNIECPYIDSLPEDIYRRKEDGEFIICPKYHSLFW